jgi:hypothetical protein
MAGLTLKKVGNDFVINTFTQGDQEGASLAPLTSGGYVAVWQSNKQNNNVWNVFGKIFNADGTVRIDEFPISTNSRVNNQVSAHNFMHKSVAPLKNGGFAVVYEEQTSSTITKTIVRTFKENGSRDLTASINSGNDSSQAPSIVTLSNGNLLVTASILNGNIWNIYKQEFPPTLDNVNSLARITLNSHSSQWYAQPGALPDGGYVIAWFSESEGIFAKIFNEDSTVRKETFKAMDFGNLQPDLAVDSKGNWMLTAQSNAFVSTISRVYSVVFNKDGDAISTEQQINPNTDGGHAEPAVVSLGENSWFTTWGSTDADGGGISGQQLDNNAQKIGKEIKVNGLTAMNQMFSTPIKISDNIIIVLFTSYLGDGSGNAMAGARYMLVNETLAPSTNAITPLPPTTTMWSQTFEATTKALTTVAETIVNTISLVTTTVYSVTSTHAPTASSPTFLPLTPSPPTTTMLSQAPEVTTKAPVASSSTFLSITSPPPTTSMSSQVSEATTR